MNKERGNGKQGQGGRGMRLCDLFFSFAKIGVIMFGGGLSMLPVLRREIVEKKKWTTDQELMDYYAIGQCTPGIIAVNTATFIGYSRAGILGGIVATLGIIAPSLVIITVIAMFLTQYMQNPYIGYALAGIRAVVCALMANTVLSLARTSLVDKVCWGIFLVCFVLVLFTNLPLLAVILAAGFTGIAVKNIKRRKGGSQ